MRVLSSNSTTVVLCSLFINTASNSVSEAFVNIYHTIAKAAPIHRSAPKGLAFQPQRLEESDYRTPAESFTFTRHAQTEVTSEYVQSKWSEVSNPQRLSYLDVISSTSSGSKAFDHKQEVTDSDTPEEPLAQAHRIQQAYREWCEVRSVIDV